jgi:tetratricopeptide (TPR) repeat protein
MTKGRHIVVLLLLVAIFTASCNKRIIPGIKPETGKKLDEATFNYVFSEALRQKLMGNNGDALKFFEQCLAMDPTSDASYFQMAEIVLNNGDFANGKKYIKKASELQPGNLWYHIMLAGIYYQQKDLDSAAVCYEKAININPEKDALQITLANLYTEEGKTEKARTILNRFDQKYGVNENTTISLVNNLINDKKYEEARSKVLELLEQKPDEILYNGLLANIYQKEGKNEKALEVYDKLMERNPEDPKIQMALSEFLLTGKKYNELFLILNKQLINIDIPREEKISLIGNMIEDTTIIRHYNSNMKMALLVLEASYKDDDIVMLLRPEFLILENKPADAAIRLEEIIKLNPNNYPAWEKLLLVYYDLRYFEKLQTKGEECATKFNRSIIAKILYAQGATENKDYNVALEELRKAEILGGDNNEVKLQIITMRADIYYRMKNYDEAFKNFDEALKLNNKDLTVLNNYAYYLAEQNLKLKEAEAMAKEVTDIEKNNTTFLDTYAWVLYKRGKTKEAAKVMEKIINSGEKADAEWYEHYGFILRKLGKCNEAVEKWEVAVALDKSKTKLLKEIEECKK